MIFRLFVFLLGVILQFREKSEADTDLKITRSFTSSPHHKCLLLADVDKVKVYLLVLLQLLHGLTERDGVRTPDVPGRSTPHTPRLAGLHALQEVVVLLLLLLPLLAGLLRPVEEVVLGEGDLVQFIIPRLDVLTRLVLEQDPRIDSSFPDRNVELGIVDHNSVAKTGIQVEDRVIPVFDCFIRVYEGVAETQVDDVHMAAPEFRVFHVHLLHSGVQGEGLLSDAAQDI